MDNYISVIFFYSNKATNIKEETLLNMEALLFVCNDKENGVEFQVECVEQESDNEYAIQILIKDWLFEGIESTLNNPTKALFSINGEEVELNVNSLSVNEVLRLDND